MRFLINKKSRVALFVWIPKVKREGKKDDVCKSDKVEEDELR